MTLPHGWTSRRFDQLGELCSGSTPSSSRTEFWDGATVWVTPTDLSRLNTPYLHDSAKHITERGLRNCSARLLPPDSIVLSSRAPIGYVAIPTVPFCTNQGCKSIALYNSYHSEFVYYAVTAAVPRLKRLGEGTTFAEISKSSLAKAEVVLPIDKAEQAKIAEVLSTVDRAIEQTEALIAKQQRIKTGLMQDLLTRGIDEHGDLRSEQTHKFKDSPLGRIPVGWDARPLSEVVDLRVGYAFKRAWFADEGVRLLRGENVGTGSADWKDTQWLSSEMADKYPEYMLAEGDIVIGMDRTFTKQGCKVTILGEADVPCLLVQRVGCFMPVRISSDYMQMVIQSAQYQRELLLQQKGMDIPHLSKGEILSPLIPIPKAVEEMESIAGCAKALRTALTNESTHLNTLRLIKTGLMQDLLTGDRRVTALLGSPKQVVGT